MSDDLGPVQLLGADAVGQPGQRRFRLFAQSRRGSAVMWLEKEQLNSLSLALDRSLALITEGQVLRIEAHASQRAVPEGMPANFALPPTYEFQVGQIHVSFNEYDSTFMLNVVPLEILMESGQEPQIYMNEDAAISFIFTQRDAQRLSSSIGALVNAGRPVCPLCHMPLDGGPHACVKQNGHREIVQIEEDENE